MLRPCEINRTETHLSTILHHLVKSPDSVLDKSGGGSRQESSQPNVRKRTRRAALLHFPRRFVAHLGDDLVLDGLALLVLYGQRFVGGGVHQLDFDFAERAVVGLVAGRVCDYVLVAQRLVDFPENRGILALEAGEERRTAGL